MRRTHVIALLAVIAVVPAALAGSEALRSPPLDGACFDSGPTAYRFTNRTTADYTIRIADTTAQADLTVQIVNDPAIADFVLLDETERPTDCRFARTIRLDPQAMEPDLVIALSRDEAEGRTRIYAQAPAFRAEDAAALFAVMRKAPKKRIAAALR